MLRWDQTTEYFFTTGTALNCWQNLAQARETRLRECQVKTSQLSGNKAVPVLLFCLVFFTGNVYNAGAHGRIAQLVRASR